LAGVEIAQAFIPSQWPDGRFDLILLSEVIYYLSSDDIARLADDVKRTLLSNGEVVLVNWAGKTGTALSGDEAVELFIRHTASFAHVVSHDRGEMFRLDVLVRRKQE
jgi:hypothetical protein